jgi:hypothetical protein
MWWGSTVNPPTAPKELQQQGDFPLKSVHLEPKERKASMERRPTMV